MTTQHERDLETGLDYRGARFYDSDIGRFLSLDPLAATFPSWSDYNYVFSNPVIYADPTGLAPEDTGKKRYDEEGEVIYDENGKPIEKRFYTYTFDEFGGQTQRGVFGSNLSSLGGSDGGSGFINTSPSGRSGRFGGQEQSSHTGTPLFVQNSFGQKSSTSGPPWIYNGQLYHSNSELYLSILIDKAASQFGIKDIAALVGIIAGSPLLKKRFVTPGTTPRTSFLSKTIGNSLGTSSVRLPTLTMRGLKYATSIGRFASRSIPLIGWGILAYDGYQIYTKTEKEYNQIINGN